MRTLTPICLCGKPIIIPVGQTKAYCKTFGCGVIQELGAEGYWAKGLTRTVLTPIFKKLNHYEKYMRWRNSRKRGKRQCANKGNVRPWRKR